MYDIKEISLGSTLREYRKIKKMTLQEVGDRICKSKVTVSKYENNEILPDFFTLLELCNIFQIDITQLCEQKTCEYDADNPFHKNKLYLYYYTNKILVESIIEIQKEKNKYKAKLFNGIRKDKIYGYYYEGDMINDRTVTYFDFCTNGSIVNEKVQIIVHIPWSVENTLYTGVYTGMSRNIIPVVKKVLVSKNKITDISLYDKQLRFSREESKNIYKENAVFFANSEVDDFFFI